MRVVETSGPVGSKGHDMPLAERMVQRPRHSRSGLSPHIVIDARACSPAQHRARDSRAPRWHRRGISLAGLPMYSESLPDVVVDACELGFAHPVGPHDPGAEPLRMVDQEMKRRPLTGMPARWSRMHSSAKIFSMKRSSASRLSASARRRRRNARWRIDVWRRVHILLRAVTGWTVWDMSCLWSTASTGVRRNLLARIGLSEGCRVSAKRSIGITGPTSARLHFWCLSALSMSPLFAPKRTLGAGKFFI